MGAINYGKSDYISIGLNVSELEYDESGFHPYDTLMKEFVESRLDELNNYYFHIVIKPGYYEGFYIDIENNFPVFVNDYEEKRDAQKEVTEIKNFLKDCVVFGGLVQYFPGWCTGYSTKEETLKAIKTAVNDMRDEINATPTYKQYCKEV